MRKILGSAGLILIVSLGSLIVARHRTSAAEGAASASAKPVEPDMHEFMEYAFEPAYKRLKLAMAAEPADKSGWKGIKADSLVLAEGGNLLLLRRPRENVATWNELSAAVRNSGGLLYQAAKQRDFAAAREHYQLMLKNCNVCHNEFAGGEHQLEP